MGVFLVRAYFCAVHCAFDDRPRFPLLAPAVCVREAQHRFPRYGGDPGEACVFPSTSLPAYQQSLRLHALCETVLTKTPLTVYANSLLGALNARSHFRSVGCDNGSRYQSTTIQFGASPATMSRADRDASGSVSGFPISRSYTSPLILKNYRNLSP